MFYDLPEGYFEISSTVLREGNINEENLQTVVEK
jgi:hypothetical protein